MFMVILLLGCLLFMLIPQLIDSVALLIGNMDTYVATMDRMIRNLNIPGLDIESQLEGLATSSEDLIKTATQFLSTSLRSIVSASRGVGRNLVNLFLALILSFYLLGSKESIKAGSKRLMKAALPDRLYETIRTFLNRCNNILVRYIVFSILDAIIVGGVNALFMAITGMQYIGLISAVVGITNLIPSFGPVIGGAIGCFILLLVNPWHALAFLIFTLVLQTVDGYLIKPKLFGNSLGVSGLLILVSIVVFGNIMGILGILLAIPLAAIIDFSYEEYFLPFLEERKEKSRSGEREKVK
jgi:predicted PurR-regulated permease PerM